MWLWRHIQIIGYRPSHSVWQWHGGAIYGRRVLDVISCAAVRIVGPVEKWNVWRSSIWSLSHTTVLYRLYIVESYGRWMLCMGNISIDLSMCRSSWYTCRTSDNVIVMKSDEKLTKHLCLIECTCAILCILKKLTGECSWVTLFY